MTDEDILYKVLDKRGHLNNKLINKLTFKEIDYINNRFIDGIDSIKEGLYRIKHNLEEKPKCCICGKPKQFKNINYGKSKFCSSKECSKQYRKNLYIKLYGGPSPFSSKEIQNNAKKTKLEKYGHEYYSNWEKGKQTNLERYGVTNWLQSIESKNRLKEKYGVEYGLQSRTIWEKTRETTINKYGASYNIEKFNQTMLEKYGVKWFTQTEKLIKASHTPEVIEKQYKTHHKNAIYKSSKQELESDKLIRLIFSDLIHIYKDKERYPWECDFYIPSLDLFIECQYHWTHGGHPYDENNENDLKIANNWKNSESKFKNTAYNVWTIRDVNKRETSKKNNLNYLEFFNINELKEWLKQFEN